MMSEYILNVCGDAFRIYGYNEKLALETFVDVCFKYSKTNNYDNKEYWLGLKDCVVNGAFSIIHNEDFLGVRRV